MEEEKSTRGIVERDIEELPRLRNKIRADAPIAKAIADEVAEIAGSVNFGPIPNPTIDRICAWYRFLYV